MPNTDVDATRVLVLSLTSSLPLDKLLNLSTPQFPDLSNSNDNNIYLNVCVMIE